MSTQCSFNLLKRSTPYWAIRFHPQPKKKTDTGPFSFSSCLVWLRVNNMACPPLNRQTSSLATTKDRETLPNFFFFLRNGSRRRLPTEIFFFNPVVKKNSGDGLGVMTDLSARRPTQVVRWPEMGKILFKKREKETYKLMYNGLIRQSLQSAHTQRIVSR